jgi:sirohydrochlorin ferrochelatase
MLLRSRSGLCSAALLGLVLLQTRCSRGFSATRLPVMMIMSQRPSSALQLAAADDLFDPLLSPHAYPDGTDAGPKQVNRPDVPWLQQQEGGGRRSKKSFGIALPTDDEEEETADLTTIPLQSPVSLSSADVFDPTLSPHLYRKGTPDVVVGDTAAAAAKVVVGILLMDHGSKSEVANERLVTLAALYQQRQEESSSRNSSKRIVRAAHMELAAPSIRDGLAALIEQGVDEIICHPYFLSPGRHVVEDIPHLVQEAMASLNVTIPVVITDPVGSNTDMMMQAIDAVVVAAASKQRVINM